MVFIDNITKRFNRTTAVDCLTMQVPRGSIFGLLGPNGAGKTTTIRMIMNILQPDQGRIVIDGKIPSAQDYRNIGYLPEERGLYQKRKLKETIVYFGTLKGLSKTAAAQQVDYYLDRFGLGAYAERKIEELSKGNQQKVQFIIAVLHRPELMIFDEPFAGLDPVNQLLLKELITEFQSKGKTVIFSTHQMEQIEKLCSTICLINDGRRVLYGDLDEIKRNYGNRRFRIQYAGDQQRMRQIIREDWELNDNWLSGPLKSEQQINDILRKVMSVAAIQHVNVVEPSLEQIFIEQVNARETT